MIPNDAPDAYVELEHAVSTIGSARNRVSRIAYIAKAQWRLEANPDISMLLSYSSHPKRHSFIYSVVEEELGDAVQTHASNHGQMRQP